MKNLFSPLTKFVALAACALTLGSCNRAEYAMLPQGASYHGVTRAATPVPAPQPVAAPAVAAAPAAAVLAPEVASPAARPVAVAVAPQPTTNAPAAATLSPADAATVATTVAAAPAKLTRVQRFAATRFVKIASQAAGITQFKQQLDTARAQKLSGNLRTGVVLLLIGLLISLFSGINRVFGFVGGVIAVIGLIFIILYLLDNV